MHATSVAGTSAGWLCCRISGTLPPELGQLPLQSLVLASNNLMGTLPATYGELTQLSLM